MVAKVLAILGLLVSLTATSWGQSLTPQPSKSAAKENGRDGAVEKEMRTISDNLTAAFNAGKSDEIAGLFLSSGELIDEEGNIYQGQTEIKELLSQFFKKFPGVKVAIEIDSIRSVGPVVIQDGTKITTTNEVASQVQFTGVFVKTEQGWRIASLRDFPEETLPTPGEQLQILGWMVGDWINEGADARVKISYRWSEDKNFLLGEFLVLSGGKVVGKTSQRIGWDPVLGKPRSWLFDSDGGFSESVWTLLEDGRWVLRSSAVLPDGKMGSATLTISPSDESRFTFAGSSRLVGDSLDEDFELTIVKQPPTANGKK
ncbi:MAG: nuclear transport factor 2 family protein [Pirellulaceae bacterium]